MDCCRISKDGLRVCVRKNVALIKPFFVQQCP